MGAPRQACAVGFALLLLACVFVTDIDGNVAEQSITCQEEKDPLSKLQTKWNDTPSIPYNLVGSLGGNSGVDGRLTLNISWTLSADGSLQVLTGTVIEIMSVERHNVWSYECAYEHPFKNQTNSLGHQWTFTFTDFNAEPEENYLVNIYNLPKANIGGDNPEKTVTIKTPNCEDVTVRSHQFCVTRGSLWEPKLTAVKDGLVVLVAFMMSPLSPYYDVHLISCEDPSDGFTCKAVSHRNVHTEVIPAFEGCQPDCKRSLTKVECSTEGVMLPLLAGGSVVLALLITLAAWVACRLGKKRRPPKDTPYSPRGEGPTKVLVIYSLETDTFQRAAVAFAELLQLHYHCIVFLDMWQKQKIAEMGPVQWLAAQKANAHFVIFLCPQAAGRGWNSGNDMIDETCTSSLADMFLLALNLFSADLKDSQNLNKYKVVHFDITAPYQSVATVLRACKSYCLLKELGRLCKDLQCTTKKPSYGCWKSLMLPEVDCQKFSLEKLNSSVQEFKKQQVRTTVISEYNI
uniref:Interleukin 17 receptor B n=1 Tax=Erpetoichthys calabaricus TaxID=27687 RepID=A0A8C4TJ65_ERPCA